MKIDKFFSQVSAARRLSVAFDNGHQPAKSDLETLGLPSHVTRSFKR
ncbi:MAG: hypothetical protein AAF940_12890 [Pseudomonadota bacterium]